MSDRIKLLPDSVANQIAAGEVVNRPASAVKEMMENAVDAGATSVTVNFRDGGKELIQVIDNGCGMSPADARLAFDKHATSKISSIDDIYKLGTFGFRGEALASIAAVGEIELQSKEENAELGTKIEINGGKFVAQTMVNCPQGTQIMVRNLFYNVPARRRFLDKSTTEARHITSEFQRVALVNPDKAFALYNNDAPVYNLPAGTLKQRIVGVIGKNITNNLLEVSAKTTIVNIEGFVGRPSASKQSNKDQYLFINGRYFKNPYFHKAILQAYEKLIPANTQPAYFVYLTLDPAGIDVNVHPQKTEVKFEDGSAVWQIINAAVRESLAKLGVVPMMDFDMDTNIEIPVATSETTYKQPEIRSNPAFNPFTAERNTYPRISKSISPNSSFDEFSTQIEREEYGIMDSDMGEMFDEESVLEYIEGDSIVQGNLEIESGTLIADVIPWGMRYAVTTIGENLAIIDILRAREAIMYAKFRSMFSEGHSVSQQLLFPEALVLSIDDYSLMQEHADEFTSCGFDIVFRDEHTIEITGVPADFTTIAVQEVIYDMIDALRDETSTPSAIKSDRLAAIMARIGSMSAQRYNAQELAVLMAQLAECPDPNYTPGGNAVTVILSHEEIKKRFK